ncbi:MAG: beta-lactamase family protein [Deferribacteres bacterium]|nr:beta-lactamase family protein [Deferribacteres bacterium]
MIRLITIILGLNLMPISNAPALAQSVKAFEFAWKKLEKYYTESLSEAGVVGSSTMFIRDGEILGASYYGMADLESKRRVDAQTIYHWASNTKMFTNIAIMQLRDRGLLSLDDPIIECIPELKAVHNPFGDMREITLRHLMSHSAGFRAPTWPWGGDKSWHPHEPTTWQQLVAMFPYTEILFKPGSKYSYSNPGIIFLGRVIELLSGDDYEVYVDKNILKPLKMYASYFDHSPYHLLQNRSNNYDIIGGEMTTNGLDFDTGITVSNGGLNAPLGDIAKFVGFLIGSETKQAAYDSILKRTSLEEMWQPQVQVSSEENMHVSMGLGFFIHETGAVRIIGHTGHQKAFSTFIYVHPPSRTGCVAAFNTVVIKKGEEGESYSANNRVFEGLQKKYFNEIISIFAASENR